MSSSFIIAPYCKCMPGKERLQYRTSYIVNNLKRPLLNYFEGTISKFTSLKGNCKVFIHLEACQDDPLFTRISHYLLLKHTTCNYFYKNWYEVRYCAIACRCKNNKGLKLTWKQFLKLIHLKLGNGLCYKMLNLIIIPYCNQILVWITNLQRCSSQTRN